MPLLSMTGYASRETVLSEAGGWQVSWDLRSVNGKGLDLRLRLPDGLAALEAPLRTALARHVQRGTVTLALKLARTGNGATSAIDGAALGSLLDQLRSVEEAAIARGVALVPTTALDILRDRSLLVPDEISSVQIDALGPALLTDLEALADAFQTARRAEGHALARVLLGRIEQIETLIELARSTSKAREEKTKLRLNENMMKIMDTVPADPARVAQELALLAVKGDVTEELDRLGAHCAAARALLADGSPAGRKLDFLCQEFNREANTLCAKSGDPDLTRLGLDLKTLIDQLREQVQNVE